MYIPHKILVRLEILRTRRMARESAERQARRAEAKRQSYIENLRQSRMPELLAQASFVAKWFENFFESKGAKKFFREMDKVRIFCAPFCRGCYVPEANHTTFAEINIHKSGKIIYSERYRGMPADSRRLGKIPINIKKMIAVLHPDYLKQLAEHLQSGAVWDYINMTILIPPGD